MRSRKVYQMPHSTYKGKPMRYFIVDRTAAGFAEQDICHQFRMFFEVTDSDAEIMSLVSDKAEFDKDVEEQKTKLLEEIDRTNITGMILKHLRRLDEKSEETEDIGDLVKITTVLTTSLATLRPKSDSVASGAKNLTVNYYNQFNANFITDLESQKIIKIVDEEKFKRLFLSAPAPSQPPEKPPPRQRAQEVSPDDVASFL